jgi:uncharacterized membrane protein YkgB
LAGAVQSSTRSQAPVEAHHLDDFDVASRIIGTTEIVCALLIAAGTFLPIAAALGGAMGISMFFATLSLMFSTHVMWDPGFPALSSTGSARFHR